MTIEAWIERMPVRYRFLPQPYWAVFVIFEALLLGAWLTEYVLLRRIRRLTGDPVGCARMDRRYVPAWIAIFLIAQYLPYRAGTWRSFVPHDWAWVGAGVALAIGGLALRVHSIRCLAENFSYVVHVGRRHRLVTRGVYRWIRHPAYLGLLLFFAGTALELTDSKSLFMVLGGVGIAVAFRIRREERGLRERFGAEYEAWKRRTRLLIPFLL